MAHTCYAQGCTTLIHPRQLMCFQHWRKVPKPLQKEVWKYYRQGQEEDKMLSKEHLIAARNAIKAVAAQEGKTLLPEVRGG